MAWLYVARDVELRDQQRFDNTVYATQQAIERRTETYVHLLRGLRGLFAASSHVSYAEFNAYLQDTGLTKHYPGLNRIGYSPKVGGNERQQYIHASRQQISPNYAITPSGGRPEYFPNAYLYPAPGKGDRHGLGYDELVDPVRRAALLHAADTAQPTASGKIMLYSDHGKQGSPGFIIYIPIYRHGDAIDTVEQRRNALQGLIHGEFSTDNLLQDIFTKNSGVTIDFEIFDGMQLTIEHLLHDDDRLLRAGSQIYHSRFSRTLTTNVAGRDWTLYFSSLPSFDLTSERQTPLLILLSGLLMSCLLAGLIALKSKNVREHNEAAEARHRLASIMETTTDFISFADLDKQTLYINEAGRKMVGVKEQDVPLLSFADLSPPWAYNIISNEGIPAAMRDGVWYGETALVSGDGREIPISHVIIAHKRADGTVEYLSTIARDITERKQNELRLTYLAQYDMLTGLPNRNLFYDRLAHAMARAVRSEHLMALMFLDLDRFKDINDTLGHGIGDQVLKGVAERLKVCLREVDTIARLGGDEFTIVLEEITQVEQAVTVAQKILDTLAHPQIIEGEEIFVSTSIGIILYPLHADDIDSMLKKADIAMYQAKAQGRNNYQFYAPDMAGPATERVSMESKLRHALERDELTLYYQPQVDLKTGRIMGVEALLRWQHPELGLISPDQFINLAEDTGLIVPIGEWVLNKACQQNRAWQEAGMAPFRISVNLSVRQFRQANLLEVIEAALYNSRLAPEYLGLEITEGLLMDNSQASKLMLAELIAKGVYVAIDDFGTGYSSLSYLKEFPVDALKIDQSFIQNITTDTHNAAIATAIITLGHSLNLSVVAEGVETHEQLIFLRGQDCDAIQGYLVSPPLPAEAFVQLVTDDYQDLILAEA